MLEFEENMVSKEEVHVFREYKDWEGTACTTKDDLSNVKLRFSVETEPAVSEISVKAATSLVAMKEVEVSGRDQNWEGTAHGKENSLSRELSVETLSARRISANKATRLLALKEVEASREETISQGIVCDTEVKIETESSSEISVEAASLLLAMKLLKLVPPDFCLLPPSSTPFSFNLHAKQSSPSSPLTPSFNLAPIKQSSPPRSPSSCISTIPVSPKSSSSCCTRDTDPLPLALKLMNVIPPSFSFDEN